MTNKTEAQCSCGGDRYLLIGCCGGQECGCGGRPTDVDACPQCNPDGDKDPSDEILRSYPWFFVLPPKARYQNNDK